jgi:hypothetical protein
MQPPLNGCRGFFFPPRVNRQMRLADHTSHPYAVVRFGMSGVIPLLFLHAFVVSTGTNVRFKENVFLFRCLHWATHSSRKSAQTKFYFNLKQIADMRKRKRSRVSENKKWERRFGSKRRKGRVRNVAVEYSVFGKSWVHVSVRIESILMFLLITFRPSKQVLR